MSVARRVSKAVCTVSAMASASLEPHADPIGPQQVSPAVDVADRRDPVGFDALIESWREAFEAADHALRAASVDHDLPADELRARSRHLSDERAAAVRLLGALARDHHTRPMLVRLVASPREAKQLLGIPNDVVACVFSLDGVLVPSSDVHADAWKVTFDEFMAKRIERSEIPLAWFSRQADYARLIHGRSRDEAVRAFLASRGLSLPDGTPDDAPGSETVHGLANRKAEVLSGRLARRGVGAFAGARLYLQLVRDAGLRCAVVSSSTSTGVLLERAGLADLVDEVVDGTTMAAEGLHRKPDPGLILGACRHLGVDAGHAAVFQTMVDGVVAGRAGGFELVVAIEQDGNAEALRAGGADLVITDLGELLERSLSA